tara:strand:- start:547 stop:1278 length:732 start_codon:yes stop_codon:yes gene_type:complete
MFEKIIEFQSPLHGFIPEPKPASFFIPQAYKDMPSYVTDSKKFASIKKCIPFLDAYTMGYIIPFPVDYEFRPAYVHPETGEPFPSEFGVNETIPLEMMDFFDITEHGNHQVPEDIRNRYRTLDKAFKISNPWIIKTPPGYSCICTSPYNQNSPMEPITAVVDTDNYKESIKFPFYFTGDPNKQFMFKRGSPMVLIIPFKRTSWKVSCKFTDLTEWDDRKRRLNFFSTMVDNYKTKTWVKKSYK